MSRTTRSREAIVLLLERSKLVAEGAGAASVAALLHGAAGGPDVCALISGGNIDPTLLVSVVRHGLTRAGRYLVLRTRLPDRPGELLKLIELVAAERGNIIAIDHRREGVGLDVVETGVALTLQTRDEEHCRELVAALEARGYPVEVEQLAAAAAERDGVAGEVGDAALRDRADVEAFATQQRRGDPSAGAALAHGDDRLLALERVAARPCAGGDTGCCASRGYSRRRAHS